MGNQHGGQKALKKQELKKLVETTHFDIEEIRKLFEQFKGISSSREDDGVIDKQEFQNALGLKDSLFVDRMFSLFDEDNDGTIDFREFICGLSVFCEKGTIDEKLKFSFRIYDFDNDGCIDKEELFKLLEAIVQNSLGIPQEQLHSLVDATFAEADTDGDGKISFEEYRVLVTKHPAMIGNMTITTNVKRNTGAAQ
ncbi:serine/threonine-protein phosphatase 2B regulatory subunit [Acrasis kona]|uniref:Serine/threonine-protein phosphatase 2B regulatory subunit n=1 Tax=Acrasis kona TaxID=1008807 RepID=A0AAW2YTD7_9EUKA